MAAHIHVSFPSFSFYLIYPDLIWPDLIQSMQNLPFCSPPVGLGHEWKNLREPLTAWSVAAEKAIKGGSTRKHTPSWTPIFAETAPQTYSEALRKDNAHAEMPNLMLYAWIRCTAVRCPSRHNTHGSVRRLQDSRVAGLNHFVLETLRGLFQEKIEKGVETICVRRLESTC